jgi:hypothetical protein
MSAKDVSFSSVQQGTAIDRDGRNVVLTLSELLSCLTTRLDLLHTRLKPPPADDVNRSPLSPVMIDTVDSLHRRAAWLIRTTSITTSNQGKS